MPSARKEKEQAPPACVRRGGLSNHEDNTAQGILHPREGIWTNLLPLRFLLFRVPEQFKSRMPFLLGRNGIPIKRL
ncbi:hypothetical protein HMPREF3038_01449 [Akkermansia sp. KLE1797]|nr:hypothetical protein HMPREF3038_01449 [Akkermansia sp. KLE1797]